MALENNDIYINNESSTADWKIEIQERFSEIRELAQDPEVQESLNTMTDICLKKAYSKEMKILNTINCAEIYKQIIDKNPQALLFISTDLQLPVSEKNFSNLNGIQKMSFMALNSILTSKKWAKENYTNDVFQKLFQKEMETMTAIINTRFEWTNLSNVNHLATTLKEMGVKETAIPKVKNYLLWLQKIIDQQQQKAAGPRWYIIVFALWIVIWKFGRYIISNPFDKYWTVINIFPVDTYVYGRRKITDPMGVLSFSLATMEFEVGDYNKREQFWIELQDSYITKKLKQLGNQFQSSEIAVKMRGNLNVTFDLTDPEVSMEIDDTTHTLYVTLWEPKITMGDWDFDIPHRNREFFQSDTFKNQIPELTRTAKQEVLKDVSLDPKVYEQAIKVGQQTIIERLWKKLQIEAVELSVKKPAHFKPAPDGIKFNRE